MNIVTAFIAAGAASTTLVLATPATAHEACDPCSTHQVVSASRSPYAVPLRALHGRTLAQYLARHNEHRLFAHV